TGGIRPQHRRLPAPVIKAARLVGQLDDAVCNGELGRLLDLLRAERAEDGILGIWRRRTVRVSLSSYVSNAIRKRSPLLPTIPASLRYGPGPARRAPGGRSR